MKISEFVEEFKMQLYSIVGRKCWSFIAGEGTGGTVACDFGEKIPVKTPRKNPYLTEEQRKFEGEMSLFIQCAWRLDSKDAVICGWMDSNVESGPMLKGLNQIVGCEVESIEILSPAYDLIVGFSGDLLLKVFCDQTNLAEGYDNYSFFVQDKVYIVRPRGQIACEMR